MPPPQVHSLAFLQGYILLCEGCNIQFSFIFKKEIPLFMSFFKTMLHLTFWLLLIGAIVYFVYPQLPTQELQAITRLSYIVFGFISIFLFQVTFLIEKIAPRQITMGVFALVVVRFLAVGTFFLYFDYTYEPKSKLIVLPFGLLFIAFSIIENVYLLKYANHIEKKFNEKKATT